MTDTPVPDVRELARRAAVELPPRQAGDKWIVDLVDVADAVLAAVTPVIEERAAKKAGEEIAVKLDAAHDAARSYHYRAALMRAAAIARSHSTQPTEEETTNG